MKPMETSVLRCPECELGLSVMEAYGPDHDKCPNPDCRTQLKLTEKGRKILRDELIEKIADD